MKRIVYLTFNDHPGGIYSSQVIDVCTFLNAEKVAEVTLVSIISRRGFDTNASRIKSTIPNAFVLKMFPGIRNWKWNRVALRRALKKLAPDMIIARGPFATLLAKSASTAQVCFDARGAYEAEFTEYDVSSGSISQQEIHAIEQDALVKADFRIAVSKALVDYWKSNYSYSSNAHVVIPCTMSSVGGETKVFSSTESDKVRIVFAGGNGKWQSLDRISELLSPFFFKFRNVELVLLTNNAPKNFPLIQQFPDRVSVKWLDQDQVGEFLATCDYGWIYREQSMTNKVASPVKFAEYLAAGLSVLISDELGDFSEFVEEHKCGFVLRGGLVPELEVISKAKRVENIALAQHYFSKRNYLKEYRRVVACE